MTTETALALSGALAGICAITAGFFLRACAKHQYRRAFWLKGLAGLCFVACSLLGRGLCSDGRFARLTLLGLCLGLLGDQLLAVRYLDEKHFSAWFVAGASAFGAGHLCYLAALLGRFGFSWWTLPLLALGLALAWFYARGRGTDPGRLLGGAVGYIALVTLLAAVALGCALKSPGAATALFALGGVLFAVSDNVLCAASFGQLDKGRANTLVHATYYLAQFCIALSMFWI